MQNTVIRFLFAVAAAIIMASCGGKVPEHGRYIPKDAIAVLGVDMKQMGKTLAWEFIKGSDLLDKMKEDAEAEPTDAALENAGIDILNDIYVYINSNATAEKNTYLTIIIPLNDAKKWEHFLKNNYSISPVKTLEGRQEAFIDNEIIVSWNDEMALLRKALSSKIKNWENYTAFDETGLSDKDDLNNPKILSQDMVLAFQKPKENIAHDLRFSKLERQKSDLLLWVNYASIMNATNKMNRFGGPTGLAMTKKLWENAALASEIHFESGAVKATTKYYMSETVKEIYGKQEIRNTDKDLLDRMPKENLNMFLSFHTSFDAMKAMFEKMGLLGLLSMGLTGSDITSDDIFNAFTGDMAMSFQNFKLVENHNPYIGNKDSTIQNIDFNAQYLYGLKIKDKKRFEKLLGYLIRQNSIVPVDAHTYKIPSADSFFICIKDSYVGITNDWQTGKNFINGMYQQQSKTDVLKKEIYGQPFAYFADIQSFLHNVPIVKGIEPYEKRIIDATQKVFDKLIINGGNIKGDAYNFELTLDMMNQNENSLLEIINYINEVKEISKAKEKEIPVATSQSDIQDNLVI